MARGPGERESDSESEEESEWTPEQEAELDQVLGDLAKALETQSPESLAGIAQGMMLGLQYLGPVLCPDLFAKMFPPPVQGPEVDG